MNSTFPMFFFKPAGVKLDSAPCCKEKHYTVRAMESKNVRPRDPEVVELTGKKGANSLIKPFTRQNLFCYYVPALGTASYTVLSINVLNPYLQYSFFNKGDVTHILLGTSLFGFGCYLYTRPHIKASGQRGQYGYAALGSVMFNFGSVLAWAILRSMLPRNVAICSAVGLASSYVLVQGATSYIKFVDNKNSI